MDLTCVVRRDIKVLSKRKCIFSDSILKAHQCVDIFPDPELAATYVTSKNKEIGIQCLACNVSALQVHEERFITCWRPFNLHFFF